MTLDVDDLIDRPDHEDDDLHVVVAQEVVLCNAQASVGKDVLV